MTTDEPDKQTGVIIPAERVAEEVLRRVIESFVLEEGTDYGHEEFSLADKVRKVEQQLAKGELDLVFDPETETCSVRRRGYF